MGYLHAVRGKVAKGDGLQYMIPVYAIRLCRVERSPIGMQMHLRIDNRVIVSNLGV